MKIIIFLLVVALGLTGCSSKEEITVSEPLNNQSKSVLPQSKSFRWGEADILLEMSKQEVLREISKSGLKDWNNKYGITYPSKEMKDKSIWTLTFGNGSGAAPGGGVMILTFKNEKLIKIETGIVFA